MPSPAGHLLSGLIIAAVPTRDSKRITLKRLSLGAIAAAAPDLDMLLVYLGIDYFTAHRTFSHSIITVLVVFFLLRGWDYLCMMRHYIIRVPYVMISACLLSHIGLDLLGEDSYGPKGLMILWPYSTTFFHPDLNLFYSAFNSNGMVKPLRSLIWAGLWEFLVIGFVGLIVLFIGCYCSDKTKLRL